MPANECEHRVSVKNRLFCCILFSRFPARQELVFLALTDKLYTRLKPIGEKEHKYILALKKRECLMKGQDFDGQINAWDLPYYMNQVEQVKFAVDKDKLLEYFPLPAVTRGPLRHLPGAAGPHLHAGAASPTSGTMSVDLYAVRGHGDAGTPIGQFYLDLHPRYVAAYRRWVSCFSVHMGPSWTP